MLRETCSHLKPRPLPLKYGIPQGFVPGSVLFALCIQPLSNIISQCVTATVTSTMMTLARRFCVVQRLSIVLKYMELYVLSVKNWMY